MPYSQRSQEMIPTSISITNDQERRVVLERAAALMRSAISSKDEQELEALTEAIAIYDIEIRVPGTFSGRRSERH